MQFGVNLGGPNNFGTCLLQHQHNFSTIYYQNLSQTAKFLLFLENVRSPSKITTKDLDCVKKAVRMRASRD